MSLNNDERKCLKDRDLKQRAIAMQSPWFIDLPPQRFIGGGAHLKNVIAYVFSSTRMVKRRGVWALGEVATK